MNPNVALSLCGVVVATVVTDWARGKMVHYFISAHVTHDYAFLIPHIFTKGLDGILLLVLLFLIWDPGTQNKL